MYLSHQDKGINLVQPRAMIQLAGRWLFTRLWTLSDVKEFPYIEQNITLFLKTKVYHIF